MNVFLTVQSKWQAWIYVVDKSAVRQSIKKGINNFKCTIEHFITFTYRPENSIRRKKNIQINIHFYFAMYVYWLVLNQLIIFFKY